MRSTSTSTPGGGCGSTSPPSAGASLRPSRRARGPRWPPSGRGGPGAPRLYVALGVSGAMEHLVGLRRAGVIVAVNKNPKAPIFRAADLGVVADWAAMLPHLEAVLRG